MPDDLAALEHMCCLEFLAFFSLLYFSDRPLFFFFHMLLSFSFCGRIAFRPAFSSVSAFISFFFSFAHASDTLNGALEQRKNKQPVAQSIPHRG